MVTEPQNPRRTQLALSGVCLKKEGQGKQGSMAAAEIKCIILSGLPWFGYGLSGRDCCRCPLEGFGYFATFTLNKLVFCYFHNDLKKQLLQCLLFIKRHVEQVSSTESVPHIILKEGAITGAKSRQQTQHDVDARFVGVKPLISLSCFSDDLMVRAQQGWKLRK